MLTGRTGITLVVITAIGVIDIGDDWPPSLVFQSVPTAPHRADH
jgi:hypothetical protein